MTNRFLSSFSKINEIKKYSIQKQTQITLENLITYKNKAKLDKNKYHAASNIFMKKEIPIRLAHMINIIDHLPYNLVKLSNISKVREKYYESFNNILEVKEYLVPILHDILEKHDPVTMMMAQGLQEFEKYSIHTDLTDNFIHQFINNFYNNRIGIRLLIKQHLSLFDDYPELISHCSIDSIIEQAYLDAANLCDKNYKYTPNYEYKTELEDIRIEYSSDHLHYIIFEIMKNSMRAISKTGIETNIGISMAESDEEISIKMSDQGGGIKLDDIKKVFKYSYSTATLTTDDNYNYRTNVPPMEGFGYGLPTSKQYAKFFGGNLKLYSQHGYGTDVILYLRKK